MLQWVWNDLPDDACSHFSHLAQEQEVETYPFANAYQPYFLGYPGVSLCHWPGYVSCQLTVELYFSEWCALESVFKLEIITLHGCVRNSDWLRHEKLFCKTWSNSLDFFH